MERALNSHATRVALLEEMFKSLEYYARGWDKHKVRDQILEIQRFATWNSEAGITLKRRRRIERTAKKLLEELDGLGGLDAGFLPTLRLVARSTATRPKTTHGGDRRSGAHTLEGSVLRMLVRLYIEAHAQPGFSRDGPIVRFVNAGGELILGRSKVFTSDAVKSAFRSMTRIVEKRPVGLKHLYKPVGGGPFKT